MVSVLRPGDRIHNIPGYGVSTSRRAVASAAADWWLAGGAPMPIAVYQPKGAADLAASYVNLVNPGTYDAAPGIAPTFSAATGWTGAGAAWLKTGITPALSPYSVWSILARVENITTGTNQIAVGTHVGGANSTFYLSPALVGNCYYGAGTEVGVSPALTSGVLAIAGNKAYRNGTPEATLSPSGTPNPGAILLCASNSGSEVPAFFLVGNLLALAIWDTSTGHATWMPAVMAAVALI